MSSNIMKGQTWKGQVSKPILRRQVSPLSSGLIIYSPLGQIFYGILLMILLYIRLTEITRTTENKRVQI